MHKQILKTKSQRINCLHTKLLTNNNCTVGGGGGTNWRGQIKTKQTNNKLLESPHGMARVESSTNSKTINSIFIANYKKRGPETFYRIGAVAVAIAIAIATDAAATAAANIAVESF